MKLTAPPDLPAALMARFELVADLGEIDPGWSGDVATTAARVVTISDFVLGVLRRFPRELVARVADRAPLSRETLAASLDRKSLSEADAMAELRRVRQSSSRESLGATSRAWPISTRRSRSSRCSRMA